DQCCGEPVGRRGKGTGGDGGQVEVAAAGLVAVDLLQGEDVGVDGGNGRGEPGRVDDAVDHGAAVQDVEGGQAHVCTLRRCGVPGWVSDRQGVVLFDAAVRGRRFDGCVVASAAAALTAPAGRT